MFLREDTHPTGNVMGPFCEFFLVFSLSLGVFVANFGYFATKAQRY